jgi:hypothetical protein
MATAAEEVCGGNLTSWQQIFTACVDIVLTCGDAETCALNPANNEKLVFASTCIPKGWSAVSQKECCEEPDWTACKQASDCVALEMGCCDHCNGGFLMSVHKTYEDEALAAHKEKNCGGVPCTKIGCPPVEATCTAGVCGWQQVGIPPLCPPGTDTPVGKLCIRGESGPNGETLEVGGSATIQIYPEGCFSSACTLVHAAECNVEETQSFSLSVDATYCLSIDPDQDCTLPDCNGGGDATCGYSSLNEGTYTATLGDLTVEFDVPSTLPAGGSCVGSPF